MLADHRAVMLARVFQFATLETIPKQAILFVMIVSANVITRAFVPKGYTDSIFFSLFEIPACERIRRKRAIGIFKHPIGVNLLDLIRTVTACQKYAITAFVIARMVANLLFRFVQRHEFRLKRADCRMRVSVHNPETLAASALHYIVNDKICVCHFRVFQFVAVVRQP
jgi:hypothetical protein